MASIPPSADSHPAAGPPPPAGPVRARAGETVILFGLLLGFWIVLSGRFGPVTLLLGALSAALVVALNPERLLWTGGPERPFGMPLASLSLWRVLLFPFTLLWSIARANVQVAALVLHPRLPIHPAFVRLRTGLQRPFSRAVLANLITVTPGTVTVNLEDGRYLVHVLEPRLAGDLVSGALSTTVARLLGEAEVGPPDILSWSESVRDLER